MLSRPNNYDEVEVKEYDYVPLELGGHRGIIKKAELYTSEFSGNTSLKITVDTAVDDKQPSYFQTQFDNNESEDKKWSNGAIKYVSLKEDENCVKMLKAFITAVENSNNGFEYDWGKEESQLVGKNVGLVFGLEEYNSNEGELKTATKLNQFRSIDKVDNARIPNVKLLDGSYVPYNEYKTGVKEEETKVLISDEDLPF